MKKSTFRLLAALSFVLSVNSTSCNNGSDHSGHGSTHLSTFQDMQWLTGTWVGDYQGKPFYETWKRDNDTLLSNTNFAIENNKDTVVSGQSVIRILDNKIYYSSVPKPGETELNWELTKHDKNSLRFENANAPYSQTIVFEKTPEDKWKAILTTNGAETIYLLSKIK